MRPGSDTRGRPGMPRDNCGPGPLQGPRNACRASNTPATSASHMRPHMRGQPISRPVSPLGLTPFTACVAARCGAMLGRSCSRGGQHSMAFGMKQLGTSLQHGWRRGRVGRDGWRRRVYEILEVGRGEDRASILVDRALIVLIIANVIAFAAETVPSIQENYGAALDVFNLVSVFIFTIEYLLRLWSCVEVPFLKRIPPLEARFRFARRPYMLIDLAAILPFYLSLFLAIDLRILRILRLFRFLKLARYSPALHTLLRVLINERRALAGALLLMIAALLFASTGIYFLEHDAQPEKFGSIPAAAWWAMATLTTVGYGDVAPVTPLGQLFGSFVMVIGLGMFALPIAIISTGFAQEVGRRDFVITWSLLARIPLFAELDAQAIAGIMPYLHAHNYPPHWEVITQGQQGESMFFIASGMVSTRTSGGDITLRTGDFFGEIGMLEQSAHEVPFTTAARCRLLRLHREDFLRLERAHPRIAAHIRAIAEARKTARDAGRPEPRGASEIIDDDHPAI
ncbi:MAG: cyclic nucleotide-binding domain-containing protein [Rhizobiales bacterium]|nr:cyclic nucleotide-binding domain-containing protein [Hyphomicrobiales bacterium]